MKPSKPMIWAAGAVLATIPIAVIAARKIRREKNVKKKARPFAPTRVVRRWRYNAPRARVFSYWTAFTSFPQFLDGVQAVLPLERNHFLFELKSPEGGLGYWEAVLTRLKPDEEISWESDPFSSVQCRGTVRFFEGAGGTRVELTAEYGLGSSWIAAGMERFLGRGLPELLGEDVKRMKNLIETGSTEI
jgi:uncharacterized membrane protein